MKKNTKENTQHFLIRKSFNECFSILSPWISPGDCTMAIQPLKDNYQYLTSKKNLFFIKSKPYFKDMKVK